MRKSALVLPELSSSSSEPRGSGNSNINELHSSYLKYKGLSPSKHLNFIILLYWVASAFYKVYEKFGLPSFSEILDSFISDNHMHKAVNQGQAEQTAADKIESWLATTFSCFPLLYYVSQLFATKWLKDAERKQLLKKSDTLFSKDNRFETQVHKKFLDNLKDLVDEDDRELGFSYFTGNKEAVIHKLSIMDKLGHYYCQNRSPEEAEYILRKAASICENKTRISSSSIMKDPKEAYSKLAQYHAKLPELYISILYTWGRVYFYDKRSDHLRNNCLMSLNSALVLCEQREGTVRYIHELLVKRQGVWCIEIEEAIKNKDISRLKGVRDQYWGLLQDNTAYDEFGKSKDRTDHCRYNKLESLTQVLRCEAEMSKLGDKQNPHRHIIEVHDIIEEIAQDKPEQLPSELGNSFNIIGLVYLTNGDKAEARNYFTKALLASSNSLSYINLESHLGLAECAGSPREAFEHLKTANAIACEIYPQSDQRREDIRDKYKSFIKDNYALWRGADAAYSNYSKIEREEQDTPNHLTKRRSGR